MANNHWSENLRKSSSRSANKRQATGMADRATREDRGVRERVHARVEKATGLVERVAEIDEEWLQKGRLDGRTEGSYTFMSICAARYSRTSRLLQLKGLRGPDSLMALTDKATTAVVEAGQLTESNCWGYLMKS
jgi:hypothetical protein